MTIRVLLVDDQSLLRLGFRMALETQPDVEVIGEAGDGAQAVAMTRTLHPDVVLMDVRMPVMDGLEATRQIVAAGLAARILVLTTFNLDEYVYAALRAGASGFLLKNVPPADLFTGIRAVAAGDAVVAPSVTRRLIEAFAGHLPDPSTGRSPVDERMHQLTDREREVLTEVACGRSNSEIAERLGVVEGTVKIHVGRILTKLDLRDRVQVVVFAYETGLIRPGQDQPGPTTRAVTRPEPIVAPRHGGRGTVAESEPHSRSSGPHSHDRTGESSTELARIAPTTVPNDLDSRFPVGEDAGSQGGEALLPSPSTMAPSRESRHAPFVKTGSRMRPRPSHRRLDRVGEVILKPSTQPHAAARPAAWVASALAALLGLGSAAVSAYWALGGNGLLDTVGGEIEEWGRQRSPDVIVVLWLIVVIKTGVALAAPILAAAPGRFPRWMIGRLPRTLSWIAGIVLSGYGGVLTAAGLLIHCGLIQSSQDSDQRALAWHTFLWDPWFAVWGLALLTTLWLTRPGPRHS